MKKLIFFLIISVIALGSLQLHQAFANHISGQDDVFYWREHDVDTGDSVWCTFEGNSYETDKITLHCEGGTYDGLTRYGALYIMKVFDKADIQNVGGSNVFTLHYDFDYTNSAVAGVTLAIMDGAYDYTSLSQPGGFPANANWVKGTGVVGFCTTPAEWMAATLGTVCLGTGAADLSNIYGGGSLLLAGSTTPSTGSTQEIQTEGDNLSIARTVTNTLWGESTESQITVLIIITPESTSDNINFQPRDFSITNTPSGTMTWNFPETVPEATDWADYLGYNYQQNGTESDYGYFWSYDPNVPDPPTNLYQTDGISSIQLDWTAPVYTGYTPIVGYKIEREHTIGGGFSTIVPNTGDNSTTYVDSTIVSGDVYNYRVSALNVYGSSVPSNESVDGNAPASNPDDALQVTCNSTNSSFELFGPAISQSTVALCWDTFTNSTNITGYQINYTTPWGDPVTVSTNDTGNDDTRTALISNLAAATHYSFQVKTWGASNTQTNILNVTTLSNALDLGNVVFNGAQNNSTVGFEWAETVNNSTTTTLDLRYDNSFVVDCTVNSKFAYTDQTYTNLTGSYYDDNRDYTTFVFTNSSNDIITVTCEDENGGETTKYIVTQKNFPLLEQFQNFRNGTYGTTGQFGGIDMVLLAVIIISMIGFNRVNSAVGAIMTIIVIGALASFGIIAWPSILLSAFALLVLLAITSHRPDDTGD